jgi:cobyrinic acid a,c-diamide synthase
VEDPLAQVREVAGSYLDLAGIDALAETAPNTIRNHEGVRLDGSRSAPADVQARIGVFQDAAFQSNNLESSSAKVSAARDEASQSEELESPRVKIGVFQDAAFQFYYPENLEALSAAGAELVDISPLQDASLPDVDGLYLGGGFPETLAVGLSQNESFMASLRSAVQKGLPIYAECGGAVYLGERLHFEGRSFPLAGIFPVEYGFQEKPRGHGYTVLEVVKENPFFPLGETIRGHEFHYTFMVSPKDGDPGFAFRVHRGYGFDGQHDGICAGNVLAMYTHIHALGTAEWAPSLVQAAARFKHA